MPPIFPKSGQYTVTRIFTDSKNTFGSGGSINKQLIRQCCQNVISLFQPNKTSCEVICLYHYSKCTFLPFEIFASHCSKITGVLNTTLWGCVRPIYGVGPFLGPKLSCLNIFVTKSMSTILPGFFDFQPNPLLSFQLIQMVSDVIMWL